METWTIILITAVVAFLVGTGVGYFTGVKDVDTQD